MIGWRHTLSAMWRTLLLGAAVVAAAAGEPPAGRRLFALVRPRAVALEGGGRWGRAAAPSEGSPFVLMPDTSGSQSFTVRSVPLLLVEDVDAQGNAQITPTFDGSDNSGSEVPVIYATPALLGRRGFFNRHQPTMMNSGEVSQVSEPRRTPGSSDVDINIRVRPYSIFPNTGPAVSLADIPVTKPDVRDEDDSFGELGISQTMFGRRLRRAIATNAKNTLESGALSNKPWMIDHQNDYSHLRNTLHNTKYVPGGDWEVESEMSVDGSFRDSDSWLTWKDEVSFPSKSLREKETEEIREPATYLEPPREGPPEPSTYLETPREDPPEPFV